MTRSAVYPIMLGALAYAIAERPAIRRQLGSQAYQELLAVVEFPETATVNSIWATTLFPSVLELLRRECPEHRDAIEAAAKGVRRSVYAGPRRAHDVKTVRCPYCGDTAVITGQFSADCWSCGSIRPRR